jgi:trigger factor
VKTTTTLLDDDRARVEVEVPADRLEHDLDHTLGHLAESVRVPGFRKGKVPRRVVLQRLGRAEVLDETLREHLSRWWSEALQATSLHAVGRPEVDLDALPDEGEPLRFTATVRLRPHGRLPEPLELEAPRADPEVPDELVEAELEQIRTDAAPLLDVDDRQAREGDFVEVDVRAESGGNPVEALRAGGLFVQLGSGRLLEPLERAVAGLKPRESATAEIPFGDDYHDRALAGRTATATITLRAIRERDPRPLDDELAAAGSEYATVAELRAAVAAALAEQLEAEATARYRTEVLRALGRAVQVELPDELVRDRVDDLLVSFARGLERRGIDPQTYMQMTGVTGEQLRGQLEGDAVESLRQELGLEALADREGITIDDDRLRELLFEEAEGEDGAEQLVEDLMASSAKEGAREELRLRLALDRATELATPITYEQAEARARLWTPGDDEDAAEKPALWTPGQPK